MQEKVKRPWGSYLVLKEGKNFKVKSIVVNPGQRLSLQRHQHRAENWTVVQGIARATVENKTKDYKPGESIHIPQKSIHRLENPTKETLEIIEVQNGKYLGEDDIERLEDDYQRIESSYLENYNVWLKNKNVDIETKVELESIKGDKEEIKTRFFQDLEFGTGGLRGIMGAGTNRINTYTIRRATQGIANFLNDEYKNNNLKVAIAYDSRKNSKIFAQETALVFSANNIKAFIFSDITPTPLLSFAVRELGCVAGIVITASHNPPEYNGYKVYTKDGGQATPKTTEKLIKYIEKLDIFNSVESINKKEAIKRGLYKEIGKEINKEYIKKLKNLIKNDKGKEAKIVYTSLHGTGYKIVPKTLKEFGFKDVFIPETQNKPNQNFPTIKSPNPEEKEAFEIGIEKAKKVEADIVLATDPDCDRVGCAVKNKLGEYEFLNGNQVGALMIYYLLKVYKDRPKNSVIVKTIVTGNLGEKIAKSYNVSVEETLTGFKYIGEKIEEYEKGKNKKFLFGYEESYGYLLGTFVRDKDAVISSVLISEMVNYYKKQNKNLIEVLQEIEKKYGYHIEELISIKLENMHEAEKILKNISNLKIKSMGGFKILEKQDYEKRIAFNVKENKERKIELPKTKAILYKLENDSWFCVRPSGTEPKFKVYIATSDPNKSTAKKNIAIIKKSISDIIK